MLRKKLYSQFNLYSLRYYCTLKEKEPVKKSSGKRQSSEKVKNDLRKYLKSKPCLEIVSNLIPDRFLRVKTVPTNYNFVVDDNVAESIVKTIEAHLSNAPFVAEANPGLGLVTRYLLKSGLKRVHVFDPLLGLLPPLLQLINDNPDRIVVLPNNFFEIYNVIAQDKHLDGTRFETLFSGLQPRLWNEDPSLSVIGVLMSPSYINALLRSVIFRDQLVKFGRIQHFLVMSDRVLEPQPVARFKSRTKTLLRAALDLKVLAQFPRAAFLPWVNDKTSVKILDEVVHLVKVVPKADIYEKYTDEELKALWHFLHGIGHSSKQGVISYFENWMPSSGILLIKEGISPLTEVGDLTEDELLELFRIFISLPQFKETNFVHINESGLLSEQGTDESSSKRGVNPNK